MRILAWHVHGGWMDAFVRGDNDYLLPVNDAHDAWGLGRAGRPWPARVREVPGSALRDAEFDVVVLQRPEELDAVAAATGRTPGRDIPAVYLEHNTPPTAVDAHHPLAERDDILLVHVTHFNRIVWDNGRARTQVIEHGIPDPGARYRGDIAALAVVTNDPVRRLRATGADLLPPFASVAPVHAFGMRTELLPDALGLPSERLTVVGDLPTTQLHATLARRRTYLHLARWTSLGLSLLEAMFLGMPVLVLATTEAPEAVPPDAGAISTDPNKLLDAARILIDDPEEARRRGRIARTAARERHGLDRFLARWDSVLTDETERFTARRRGHMSASARTTTEGDAT